MKMKTRLEEIDEQIEQSKMMIIPYMTEKRVPADVILHVAELVRKSIQLEIERHDILLRN